jgi:hypothetical protein
MLRSPRLVCGSMMPVSQMPSSPRRYSWMSPAFRAPSRMMTDWGNSRRGLEREVVKASGTPDGERLAAWAPSTTGGRLFDTRDGAYNPGGGVPDPYRPVVAGGGEPAAGRGDRHRSHPVGMASKGGPLMSSGVPEAPCDRLSRHAVMSTGTVRRGAGQEIRIAAKTDAKAGRCSFIQRHMPDPA